MTICASRQVGLFVSGHGGQASADQDVVQETMLSDSASVECLRPGTAVPYLYGNQSETAMATDKPKKVTEPRNDLVRKLLCSDWESSATANYPNSACLADLVYAFLEDECQEKDIEVGTVEPCSHNILNSANGASRSSIAEDGSNAAFSIPELKDILQGLVSSIHTDALEALLHKEAARAVDMFKASQNHAQECQGRRNAKEKSLLKLCVMDHLRGLGFDAGICKSQAHGFTAADYEYVDVIIDGKERIFVDIDFRVEFVTARPTLQYNALLQILPEIFVGKADRLKQIIKVMCDSAKKSLKKKGMHLPPWRKYGFMHAKWLGCYKRTMKAVPWLVGKRRGRPWQGEGEWMPPPVMCAERGVVVSALASALHEAPRSCLTT